MININKIVLGKITGLNPMDLDALYPRDLNKRLLHRLRSIVDYDLSLIIFLNSQHSATPPRCCKKGCFINYRFKGRGQYFCIDVRLP